MNPSPDPVRVVCLGEILWDIVDDQRHAGGAPLNFCYHAHQAGAQATIVSRVGSDADGKDLRRYMESLGLDSSLVQVDETLPTGTVRAIRQSNGDMTYQFPDACAWDAIQLDSYVEMMVQSADIIAFGTLAQRRDGSRRSILDALALAGKNSKSRAFLDINLRPPFYTDLIIRDSLEAANILKMNEDELAIVGQLFVNGESNEALIAKLLMEQFSIETVVLTRGADPAMAWHENETATASAAPVTVADTIGCGDAFSAHFITGLASGLSLQKALEQGVRAGAVVATRHGGTPAYTQNDLNRVELL